MAKDKGLSLPDAPQYYEDPKYGEGIDKLFGLGGRMTSFDFTGDLSPLAETISTSPETTKMFLEGVRTEMDPIMSDVRKDIVNQLAASGQLESSTTANKLLETEERYAGGLRGMATQFGIADIERAMRNRIGLFGAGLDTTQTATGMAGERGERKNIFNLQNYENIVAKTMAEEKQKKGGLFGGLMGAGGGALAGAGLGIALAPFTGGLSLAAVAPFIGGGALLGGAAGALGPKGTGMGIFQGGAGMAGGSMRYTPGSTAGAGAKLRGGLNTTNTTMQGALGPQGNYMDYLMAGYN